MYNVSKEDYWLIVDDVRTLGCANVARTPEQAKAELVKKQWSHLIIDYNLCAQETGLDVLRWGVANKLLPKHVQILYFDLDIVKKMGSLLREHDYHSEDGFDWYYRGK